MPARAHSLAFALTIATVALCGCQGLISDPGASPRAGDPGRPPAARQSPEACAGSHGGPLTGESQRLDPTELGNAVEALLGFRPTFTPGFPEAQRGPVGYTTYPALNRITKRDVGLIADTADAIALQAIDHFDALLPCDPGAIDPTCADAFIDELAPFAFRGAEDASDLDDLKALYRTLRSGSPALDPPVAIAGVISAMLQSPGFLYLVERGEPGGDASTRTLTGREIANRIAFTFTDAPPDEPLLDAADAGLLASADERRAQAERLLDTPRARAAIVRFFREWFGVGLRAPGDTVPSDVAAAFDEEFRRSVEDAVFGGGTLDRLLTGDSTFVNRTLAMHYGLDVAPASDTDWVRAPLPDGLHAGLLASGAVANAHGSQTATSPTRRGRFVRERLLCQDIGEPPPGAMAQNPVLADDATVRERIEARMAVPACGFCHEKMDPIGIGLEDIDYVGRFRASYDDGSAVDSAGEVRAIDASGASPTFDGAESLGQLLGDSDAFRTCAVQQWFRFAMGRLEGDCQTAEAQALVRDSGYDLRELLLSLVASDSFVERSDGGT